MTKRVGSGTEVGGGSEFWHFDFSNATLTKKALPLMDISKVFWKHGNWLNGH
jgi:hypothetical protein